MDVIAAGGDEEQPNKSLMAMLVGQTIEKTVEKMDKQFTLPDLVAMKEGEEMPEEDWELFKAVDETVNQAQEHTLVKNLTKRK